MTLTLTHSVLEVNIITSFHTELTFATRNEGQASCCRLCTAKSYDLPLLYIKMQNKGEGLKKSEQSCGTFTYGCSKKIKNA